MIFIANYIGPGNLYYYKKSENVEYAKEKIYLFFVKIILIIEEIYDFLTVERFAYIFVKIILFFKLFFYKLKADFRPLKKFFYNFISTFKFFIFKRNLFRLFFLFIFFIVFHQYIILYLYTLLFSKTFSFLHLFYFLLKNIYKFNSKFKAQNGIFF